MKQSILLVDDDPDDIELTALAIEQCHLDIILDTAMTGMAALEFLRDGHNPPSLILLDLKMPGMSGFDLVREIRTDERLKEIPVIAVTSSNLETDRKEAFAAGANDFLHKTFMITQFCGELDKLLRRWLPR
jgi:two-component system response regulator